jgi:hypothetical protein
MRKIFLAAALCAPALVSAQQYLISYGAGGETMPLSSAIRIGIENN